MNAVWAFAIIVYAMLSGLALLVMVADRCCGRESEALVYRLPSDDERALRNDLLCLLSVVFAPPLMLGFCAHVALAALRRRVATYARQHVIQRKRARAVGAEPGPEGGAHAEADPESATASVESEDDDEGGGKR